MTRIEFNKKCEEVNKHWGYHMPMMTMEKLAECQQAISKCERYYSYDHEQELIKEIAYVAISLRALMHDYRIEPKRVEEAIEKELNKDVKSNVRYKEDSLTEAELLELNQFVDSLSREDVEKLQKWIISALMIGE